MNNLNLKQSENGKINILIITDVFKMMAGSERNISQLLTHINKEKFRFLVTCFVSGELAQKMREKGYPIFDLLRGGVYTSKGIKNLFFLKRLIHENEVSLIVTYHEGSDFYGLILSHICKIPVVSNRRDMGFKAKFHHKIAYRLMGRFFDGVVAVCDAVRQEMLKRKWFPEDKIYTIYNGVDLEIFKNRDPIKIKKDIGININHIVIGMIANFREVKGIKYFIEAASKITKYNSKVDFLIIGEDMYEPGCTKKDLELIAKEMGIIEKCHFLGRRDDIHNIISIFDIAIVPSLTEGFSNVILEYMASKKPVVATDVGGNREAVIHRETGLLVPPKDSDAIAEAVISIMKDNKFGERLGSNGRRRVEKVFSLEIMIKKYEDFFERVVNLDKSFLKSECLSLKF